MTSDEVKEVAVAVSNTFGALLEKQAALFMPMIHASAENRQEFGELKGRLDAVLVEVRQQHGAPCSFLEAFRAQHREEVAALHEKMNNHMTVGHQNEGQARGRLVELLLLAGTALTSLVGLGVAIAALHN